MNDRIKKGKSQEDAWNETSIELVAAAETHCRVFVVDTYSTMMNEIVKKVSEPLKVVLLKLVDLYSAFVALKMTGDLLRVR